MDLREAATELSEPLYRFLLARGFAPALAEELTQETLGEALAAAQEFRNEAKLFTWLCAIARRKGADHFRRQARARDVVSLNGTLSKQLALYSEQRLPQEVVEHGETKALVRQCLSQLSDQHALALQLKYVEGWSVRKMAQMVGRSESATESLLTRARERFRTLFLSSLQKGGE